VTSRKQALRGCVLGFFLSVVLLGAQDKAAADVYVVDSKGDVVGSYYYTDITAGSATAAREINGLWFQLPVLTTGFGSTSSSIAYSGENCTGNAYMEAPTPGALVLDGVSFPGAAAIVDDILYYPSPGEPSTQVICSSFFAGSCENNSATPGSCPDVTDLRPASRFDLSTLNLVPPFHLKQTRHW
jgi:hypothetical protein